MNHGYNTNTIFKDHLECSKPEPEFARFCGVDDDDRLYINPAAVNDDLRREAQRQRVIVFVKIPEGIIGLVPLTWAMESVNVDELDTITNLAKDMREAIKAGARPYRYPLASVALPGDRLFTDAVLRAMAGSKS
jgi:hypothetical protein